MAWLKSLPDNAVRRLTKVLVRTVHLVGFAGVFGHAMMQTSGSVYLYLTVVSGVILVIMEASSGVIWLVQFRGVSVYLKLLLLLLMHLNPEDAIPYLIAVTVLSGFTSHAPSWIRYFSFQHGRVVHSTNDQLG